MEMTFKHTFSLFLITLTLIICASFVKCTANHRQDEIIREDSTYICARQFKTIPIVKITTATFSIQYDSIIKAFKRKEIIYEGKIIQVNEDEHYVTILQKNKRFAQIKNIFANHQQYKDVKKNVGKYIVVTKYEYPRKRIMYKIL